MGTGSISTNFSAVRSGPIVLRKEEILGLLSRADAASRGLPEDSGDQEWTRRIDALRQSACPKTYLGVLAVLLTARALHSAETLNVLHIQQQRSERGYSAASIGRLLIPFTVEQRIDLRTRSSQIMNNQPFCFKSEIVAEMSTSTKATYFAQFFESAQLVNRLDPYQAEAILSLMFSLCRTAEPETRSVAPISGGLKTRNRIISATSQFVDDDADNGRVGQAAVAAALDVLFGAENVTMGGIADPDRSVPGDVQVHSDDQVFLWAEVKQKPVTTGDVETFLQKVSNVGGTRMYFCAFANFRYDHNINESTIQHRAEELGAEVMVFRSTHEFLRATMSMSPGTFDTQATRLITRMLSRLSEAGVRPELLDRYEATVGPSH